MVENFVIYFFDGSITLILQWKKNVSEKDCVVWSVMTEMLGQDEEPCHELDTGMAKYVAGDWWNGH